MKHQHFLILILSLTALFNAMGADRIDLSGEWRFQLDPEDKGVSEKWYLQELEDTIELPATTTTAGKGILNDSELNLKATTLKRLIQRNSYIGAAWYQFDVELDDKWLENGAKLHLERVLWESSLWVNGHPVGRELSLSTPHEYEIGTFLKKGNNRITIRIDNREKLPLGVIGHAYTEETQTIWNGILGDLYLQKASAIEIEHVRIVPRLEDQSVDVTIRLLNREKKPSTAMLQLQVEPKNFEGDALNVFEKNMQLPRGLSVHRFKYPMADGFETWSEFSPKLYQMHAKLLGKNSQSNVESTFGMREMTAQGIDILVNGKRTFLRGNLECAIFPKTGHPDVEGEEWRRIMSVANAYGINHLRMHSWTPPRAAFEAADEYGIYLQVELPNWTFKNGHIPELDEFYIREGERIMDTYGNHPSFVMFSLGNELTGDYYYLDSVIEKFRKIAPEKLYTSTTYSFSRRGKKPGPNDDFFVSQETTGGWVRGQGFLNSTIPNTDSDYSEGLSTVGIPLVTHEVGQYVVYPDLSDLKQFEDSVMRNVAYESVEKDLREKGRLEEAGLYTAASGKLAVILYKEDMERALRTPGLAGIQLLQFQDFPGQSTATVGLLDPFWESKGVVEIDEFREFCNPTVPLLKLPKRVYTNNEILKAEAIVAHFGADALGAGEARWQVTVDSDVIASGEWEYESIAIGNDAILGDLELKLSRLKTPSVLEIEIQLPATESSNRWKVWVYPTQDAKEDRKSIAIVNRFDAHTQTLLDNGAKVLLLPPRDTILKPIEGRFIPVFWSPVHFSNQPGTLGALIDDTHSVFKHFPTDFHTDWQWWDLLKESVAIDLSGVGEGLSMPFRFVDKFSRNSLPSALFEAKIGKGKLMVCTLDIESDLELRPVAAQLRKSILEYMKSKDFDPEGILESEELSKLVGEPKLVASTNSQHPDYPARNGVDGNVETIWHSDWNHKHGPPFFYQLSFPEVKTVVGYEYVPRQKGSNGMIKDFQIQTSMDGESWTPVTGKSKFPKGNGSLMQSFENAFQAKYLKLMVFSSQNGEDMATLAEFKPIFEGETPTSADVRNLGIIPGFNDQ